MKLFFQKKRVHVRAFTRDFYDRFVFNASVIAATPQCDPTGGEAARVMAQAVRREVGKVNAAFINEPMPKLIDELLGARLEIIGTAWTDSSKEAAALAQSQFTYDYLSEIGRADLWEIMGEYNKTIAQGDGANNDNFSGRVKRGMVNHFRADMFDKLLAEGHDPKTMGRVVNRMLPRKIDTTYANLAIRLTYRIGLRENALSAIQPLAVILYGYYQGAKGALDDVKLTA